MKSEFVLLSSLAHLLKLFAVEEDFYGDREFERDTKSVLKEADIWIDAHSSKESIAV